MRKYKAPGTYANFVPTSQAPVSSFDQQRVLAIVGTGQQTFERKNVLIERSSTSVIDKLPDSNIVAIESITTKPVTQKQDPANKFFNDFDYNTGDNSIIWKQLNGAKFDPKAVLEIEKGSDKFMNSIEYDIVDKNLIATEQYRIEITNVGTAGQGTYRVTKISTSEIIGEYVSSLEHQTNIIPGITMRIVGTISYDDNQNIISHIGDSVILKTECAKSHIDPTFSVLMNTNTTTGVFSIENNGSQFNTTGNSIKTTDDSKLPKLSNIITLNKDITGAKFQLSLYKNNILVDCRDIFDKLSVNVEGTIAGMSFTKTAELYSSVATESTPETIGSSNCYDLNSLFNLDTLLKNDSFTMSYSYRIKDDFTLDGANIVLQLEIIKQPISTDSKKLKKSSFDIANGTKLAVVNNGIFVRNNVVPHKVADPNEILKSIIKNIKITTKSAIKNGSYKLKIKDIANNEISIFDLETKELIGTWSTSSINNFRNAIPGLSFELYSFRDVEGLIEMNGTKDINDLSGSGVIIQTVEGIINPEVPQAGNAYYVTYKYAKSDEDYEPKVFSDYKDIVSEYGQYLVTESGMIINGITLAAEIAMQNGASPLVIVQAKSETDEEYKKAIDKLGTKIGAIDSVNAIVPLTNSLTVNKYLIDHINKYSSSEYGMYRMGYLSSLPNQPVDKEPSVANPIQGAIQTAKEINDERIVYVVPGLVTKNVLNSITGFSSIKTLPGYYLTTGVAALSLRNDPAEPLTNKRLYGFNGLVNYYSEPELNLLSSSGCLAIKQDTQGLKVRHGVTTHGSIDTLADIQSNEITLVQIKDYVINGCKNEIGDKYIGGKLKPSIVADVEFTLKALLNKYIGDGIIINYEDLVVARDLDDPRQLNVRFLIEAVYPLNYIDITFGFSTTIS